MTQTATSMQRYAFETVKTLDSLMEKGGINAGKYDFVLLAPRKGQWVSAAAGATFWSKKVQLQKHEKGNSGK